MITDKKTAVVTGSGRGIGNAIAKMLAENGWHVVFNSTKSTDAIKREMEALTAGGLSVQHIACDIQDKFGREKMLEQIYSQCGKIDLWVNNAGVSVQSREDILRADEADYRRVMDINLNAAFFLTQAVANMMIKAKAKQPESYCPKIVNIGSISAYTASASRAAYCISKAGLSMVTSLFAARLAEYNIGVFEVRPGIIETDMISTVKEKYSRMVSDGLTPLKRLGQPTDIAKCVYAISCGYLDFAQGQVINADGGFHLRTL